MKELKDIRDDQIRIIGEGGSKNPLPRNVWIIILTISGIALIGAIIFLTAKQKEEEELELKQPEPALFEPVVLPDPVKPQWIGKEIDSLATGFTEIRDTLINDIPIRIYIPHNAEMSLHIGRMDKSDTSIVYVAQAADVRADNGGIVGAFVLNGEPKAWGLSKKGFCASINGKVTIGVADNTSLFEEATMNNGYFFRQYGLIADGKYVKESSRWKYSSLRRALCLKNGECLIVETLEPETFPRFSYLLEDLQVDAAIYLVGGESYGFARDRDGRKTEFGIFDPDVIFDNTSFILWKF